LITDRGESIKKSMPWPGILWNDYGVNWHYTDFGCKQETLLLPFKAQVPNEYICCHFNDTSLNLASFTRSEKGFRREEDKIKRVKKNGHFLN